MFGNVAAFGRLRSSSACRRRRGRPCSCCADGRVGYGQRLRPRDLHQLATPDQVRGRVTPSTWCSRRSNELGEFRAGVSAARSASYRLSSRWLGTSCATLLWAIFSRPAASWLSLSTGDQEVLVSMYSLVHCRRSRSSAARQLGGVERRPERQIETIIQRLLTNAIR